jgi:hypothetical protein
MVSGLQTVVVPGGEFVVDGRLDAQIGLEESWREHGPAIEALLHRTIAGKAVLHVD